MRRVLVLATAFLISPPGSALAASPTMSTDPTSSGLACGTPGLDLCTPGADVSANFPAAPLPVIPGGVALGLVPGDAIASLSFGIDGFVGPALIRFSVAAGSVGFAGALPAEAIAGEAHADIYVGGSLGAPAANTVDADGDGLPAAAAPATGLVEVSGGGLPPFDELSALATCDATSAAAIGSLAFFTLAPGSPTLGAVFAGAEDVLLAPFGTGAPPVLAFPGAAMGLVAGDAIDALALQFLLGPLTLAFSLAPGSPSLACPFGLLCGFGPEDLFLWLGGGPAIPLLPGASFGLAPGDDLDALDIAPDADVDVVNDACDNCPGVPNNDQADKDGDGSGNVCDAALACPASPLVGCSSPGKAIVMVKDLNADGPGAGDKVVWKWLLGPATVQSDFGDPTTSADYRLCLYDGAASTLRMTIDVAAGGALWSPISTLGYKYVDAARASDGVLKLLLKGSSTGTAKALTVAKDANIPLPTLPLDTGGNVIVQLSHEDGANCWETSFPPASVIKNQPSLFKAVTP